MKNKIMLLALLATSNFLVGSNAGAGAGTVDSSDYTAVLSDPYRTVLEAVIAKRKNGAIKKGEFLLFFSAQLKWLELFNLVEKNALKAQIIESKSCDLKEKSIWQKGHGQIVESYGNLALEAHKSYTYVSGLESRRIALEKDAASKFSKKAVAGISVVAAISGGLAVHLLSKPGVQEKIGKLINGK